MASQINTWCSAKPSVCPGYDSGMWIGEQFLVEDFSTNPPEYGGAAAYDHGWDAAMMVEAWIQETDPVRKATYEASARLAADWSEVEPSVRNHNYTAKNIWVLAQLYAITGESRYKTELENKLDRNLKPGVLMDANSDGFVDGMSNQPFSGLTLSAQTPGRMWDGHNANPWYHSMNAWAAVEAYVAFRDRGDTARAADIRPYMIAMLDNLAVELVTQGPPATSGEHMWPIPYALRTALWKVADYEIESHPLWEDAVATLYNWGLFNSIDTSVNNLSGRGTAALGLYLVYLSGTTYEPLDQRLNSASSTPASDPTPADLATDVPVTADLTWAAGVNAVSHDVYVGTNASLSAGDFQANQTGTTFDPGSLNANTTYYWRIDELDGSSTITGPVWSFTTEQGSGGPAVLLYDDFESNSFATEGWTTNWGITTQTSVSGNRAAVCTFTDSDLISRSLDTSGLSQLTVSFYYYDDDIDNNDNVYLQFYNGISYVNIFELGNTSPEDNWHFYTLTVPNSGSESQYFHSNFKIRISRSGIDWNENLGIDDVKVEVQ